MRVIFSLLSVLFAVPAFADNLSTNDYFGTWRSDWVAVKGESQTLQINSDSKSVFSRTFADGKRQVCQSGKIEKNGDLLILRCEYEKGGLVYKLVLSGWKLDEIKKIYGTMYMYKDGVQFNGLPVSFSAK